jgi:Tfp pilus assembly PilM family ATPase
MDAKDPAAAGAWLASEMDRAGMGRAKLVFAVPRGEVVLKTMKFPRVAGGAEGALAGMVRLQMTRQLTMAVEGTAIDYAPIGEEEGEKPSVSVLAAALPGERLAWYRDVAKAAGCKVERVGLRASGLAAVLAAVSERHTGPVLGIAAGWGSVEFVVVSEGRLVFARSADVGLAAEGEFVPRVAVEAKRTWMSFRGAEGTTDVDAVVIPDRGALAQELGQACAEAMELPFERAEMPAAIEMPELSQADRLVLMPLIGLLAEETIARPTIDFATPRKAPDLAAAKRVRVLAGALGAIVVGGSAIVYGMWDLNQAKAKLRAAEEAGGSLRAKQGAYLAEAARLSDIQKWTGARVDWLSHLKFLSDQMPDSRQGLMDQVSGSLAARVEFAAKDKYDPKAWQASQRAAFSIQGHVKQRDIADNLRERLVAAKDIYSDVESKGPDTPEQFALSLVSGLPTAEKPVPAKELKQETTQKAAEGSK